MAWEARTGPRQTQTFSDTPATARRCGRAGRESHDSKANDDEGSPRLQPPAHIRTLALDLGSSQCTFLQMTYTAINPHACCNWPRPEDAHASSIPESDHCRRQ